MSSCKSLSWWSLLVSTPSGRMRWEGLLNFEWPGISVQCRPNCTRPWDPRLEYLGWGNTGRSWALSCSYGKAIKHIRWTVQYDSPISNTLRSSVSSTANACVPRMKEGAALLTSHPAPREGISAVVNPQKYWQKLKSLRSFVIPCLLVGVCLFVETLVECVLIKIHCLPHSFPIYPTFLPTQLCLL